MWLCGDENLANELTSETFYQAHLHIGSFRGDCKVETWLCQIAKNAFHKESTRRKRHVSLEIASDIKTTDDVFNALSDKEQVLRIHKYLHNSKKPYREVFTLRVLGELSFREIADICGKTESWAKVTFYRTVLLNISI